MTHLRILRLLAVAILTALALAACGSDDNSGQPTGEATPDVHTILQDAIDQLAATSSLRFNLDIDGDTWVDEDRTIRLISAQGDLARPNRVDVQFQVELLGAQTASIRMITVGEQSWTTDLLTGDWGPAPEEFGYNPGVLFDPDHGLGAVTAELQTPAITGSETLGGRATWKVTGTVGEDAIAELTSGTIQGDSIAVTLWVDKKTSNVLQLRVAEPETSGKDQPATWTMRLTAQNADLDIEPPDVAG